MSDLTPDRLDGLMNGSATPEDQDERDMLALAGALREGAPGASDDLRARVEALPEPQGAPATARRPGWGRRALIAGPALVVAIAVLVGGGIVFRSGSDEDRTSLERSLTAERATEPDAGGTSAAGSDDLGATSTTGLADAAELTTAPGVAAPPVSRADAGPASLIVPAGTLAARLADIEAAATAVGGVAEITRQPGEPPRALAAVTVPEGRGPEMLAALEAIGTPDQELTLDADVGVRVMVTEVP